MLLSSTLPAGPLERPCTRYDTSLLSRPQFENGTPKSGYDSQIENGTRKKVGVILKLRMAPEKTWM